MSEFNQIKCKTLELIEKSGFPCSQEEIEKIEFADFGLKNPTKEGAQILTLSQTNRLAAKLIVLLPRQILPEHYHVSVDSYQAKQEILRVIYGGMHLFSAESNGELPDILPEESRRYYTCNSGCRMKQGDNAVIDPPTPHWFFADDEGCVILYVSTTAFDAKDVFTNPNIVR